MALFGVGNYTRCESDHQCSEHMYCYLLAGHCVRCTDCVQYKRENGSLYPYCSKSVDECGNCLTGFKEAIFTTGKVQDTCILTNQPVKQSMTGCIVLGVIVSVGLILFLLAYCWNKAQRKREHVESVEEERAPEDHELPAENSPPLATSLAGGVSDIQEMNFTNSGQKELGLLQQPSLSRRSNMSYYSSDDEQEERFYTPPLWNDEMELNAVTTCL